MLLGVRDEGVDEPVHRLALRLGYVCERLPGLELVVELFLAQAQIGRGGVEPAEHLVVLEAVPRAEAGHAEKREIARFEALLQFVGLVFGEMAGRDRGVDALLERALERRGELARRDAVLLRLPVGRLIEAAPGEKALRGL